MFNSTFDELKEVKVLKRNHRFQLSYYEKYFKEIKRLKSLQVKGKEYLEHKRTSTMESFCEYT